MRQKMTVAEEEEEEFLIRLPKEQREGEFIDCANCPSTYHTSCIDKQGDTSTKLLCPYCICKYCGDIDQSLATCCQCHKKFHRECLQANEKEFVIKTLKCSKSYCEPNCKLIHEKMEVSLGVKYYINEKYSWRIVRKMNRRMEVNSKIAHVGTLMCGAFEKIIDTHTGMNVVENVVYSCRSHLMRVNFHRFYAFVIEEDDAVIAAALIRFNGRDSAEMPFIATHEAHRGKGICRLLMAEIESFLRSLEIKNLIIPSGPEFVEMWKGGDFSSAQTLDCDVELGMKKILFIFLCVGLLWHGMRSHDVRFSLSFTSHRSIFATGIC
ncbi:GNAT family acetyltransferase [Trifolium pratense]|uniref:GNAT family acetyltransferase n=1 Tax=Trifolium pratense TaxID=57577 RepID=A0A2K3N2H3_TRIPR|nr:GNAT family acetyltransferase [Trifolium pratense]